MPTYAFIALFAVCGAALRDVQTQVLGALFGHAFPYATLSINVTGALLMGFLSVFTVERTTISPALRAGLLTGGLGAYTTFSTFSLESLQLLQRGAFGLAGAYMLGSLLLGLSAAALGARLALRIGAR